MTTTTRSFARLASFCGRGAFLLVLATTACVGGEGDPTPEPSTTEPEPSDGGEPEPSPEPEPQELAECDAVDPVQTVEGSVVDENGAGIEGAIAQMCVRNESDRLSCLAPSTADANGEVLTYIPTSTQCAVKLTVRTLLPNGGRASMYCRADLSSTSMNTLSLDPIALPTLTAAADLPDVGDEDSVRDVALDDNVTLRIAPGDIYPGDYDLLGSRVVVPADLSPCIRDGLPEGVSHVLLLGPEGNANNGVGLVVDAASLLGAQPDDSVDMFALGVLGCMDAQDADTLVEEGTWAPVQGPFVVDADGSVATNDVAIPCVGAVAFRVAQPD